MEIIDITRTVDPKMLKWPDDTEPPSQEFVTHTDNGDPATVSEWKMSSHTGTHMDARMHFIPGGWTMEALDLARSVGPCRVVDLTHVEGHVEPGEYFLACLPLKLAGSDGSPARAILIRDL